MMHRLQRSAAHCIGHWLARMLPASMRPWADAMAAEIAQVGDDAQALDFALGCLWACARVAVAHSLPFRLLGAAWRRASLLHPTGHEPAMTTPLPLFQSPRRTGLVCAVAATLIGCLYMATAGAPVRYPVLQVASLAAGILLYATLPAAVTGSARMRGVAVLCLGLALLATAVLGRSMQDVTRWVVIGPLNLHVGMMLLPFMLVTTARGNCSRLALAGLAVAAVALALQPDRAMAGALAAGLALFAWRERNARTLLPMLLALAGFGITLLRADPLPAAPFVEGVVAAAFQQHAAAGLAAIVGQLLLLLPAWADADRPQRARLHMFAVVWLAIIVASLLGNYPTPLVGYGGSAILGYLVSLAALPARRQGVRLDVDGQRSTGQASPSDRSLRVVGA